MHDATVCVIFGGTLILGAKMWSEWCTMLEKKMRMTSILEATQCALEICKILSQESQERRRIKNNHRINGSRR